MVKVAVAGGTQGLGSVIVKAIKSRGSHECFILSRNTHKGDTGYITVDYSNIESLQAVLEANEIHTVVSTLSMENGGGKAQMNLIEAADRSRSTHRFLPSEFGMVYKSKHIAALPSYAWKLKAAERLDESTLHYTLFSNGLFMDYMTSPRIPTPLTFSIPFWVDLENNFAAIPGGGEGVVAMAHTSDIGRFAAAVLDLPQWDKRYHLIGDSISINDMVRVAEQVKGVEFEKHYDRKESLFEHKCTLLPIVKEHLPAGIDASWLMEMVAAASLRLIDADMKLDVNLSVNRLFPEISTRTFRDAVRIWKDTNAEPVIQPL